MIQIYTDGAYSSKKQQGGWAFIVIEDDEEVAADWDGLKNTTNNRMEMLSVIKALLWLKEENLKEAEIISDSMYVIGTMRDNWKRNANHDLWQDMEEARKNLSITWTHVKGHSGDFWNDRCDVLAVQGSQMKCDHKDDIREVKVEKTTVSTFDKEDLFAAYLAGSMKDVTSFDLFLQELLLNKSINKNIHGN